MASLFEKVDKTEGMMAVLDHLGIKYNRTKRGWAKISCPNAAQHRSGVDRNPSCSMRLDKGIVNCHSCQYRGDWAQIALDILGWKVDQAVEELGIGTDGGGRAEYKAEADKYFLF